jgi:hypothetical protein
MSDFRTQTALFGKLVESSKDCRFLCVLCQNMYLQRLAVFRSIFRGLPGKGMGTKGKREEAVAER